MQVLEEEKGNINDAFRLLRAIAHPFRLELINLIVSKKKIAVHEVIDFMQDDPSKISQHLKKLKDAQVVTTQRQGKVIYYMPQIEKLKKVALEASIMYHKYIEAKKLDKLKKKKRLSS